MGAEEMLAAHIRQQDTASGASRLSQSIMRDRLRRGLPADDGPGLEWDSCVKHGRVRVFVRRDPEDPCPWCVIDVVARTVNEIAADAAGGDRP